MSDYVFLCIILKYKFGEIIKSCKYHSPKTRRSTPGTCSEFSSFRRSRPVRGSHMDCYCCFCSCRWGETMNCGHQRSYSSSPRWDMSMARHDGIILTEENWRARRKACPSAALYTTNPTWTDRVANSCLRREMSATNSLRYGMARPCVPETLTAGKKRLECESDQQPHLLPMIRMLRGLLQHMLDH
jgi:hypothetical protein